MNTIQKVLLGVENNADVYMNNDSILGYVFETLPIEFRDDRK